MLHCSGDSERREGGSARGVADGEGGAACGLRLGKGHRAEAALVGVNRAKTGSDFTSGGARGDSQAGTIHVLFFAPFPPNQASQRLSFTARPLHHVGTITDSAGDDPTSLSNQ